MHHTIIALQAAGTTGGSADVAPMLAQSGLLLGVIDGGTALVAIAVAAVLIAVLYPIARAFAQRMERGVTASAIPAGATDAEARLQRLEQSMEAMELELERVSEGQRYTTKLLTERLPLAARIPQPGQGEKTLL